MIVLLSMSPPGRRDPSLSCRSTPEPGAAQDAAAANIFALRPKRRIFFYRQRDRQARVDR
jgi:hypothetical protein